VLDSTKILRKLVSIPSEVRVEEGKIVRENYEKIVEVIADFFNKISGVYVEILDLKTSSGENVPAVIASIDVDAPSVAFVSHYDVVPAKGPWIIDGKEVDPYKPLVLEDRVYGRGASDDKSAIVSSIIALSKLVKMKEKLKYRPFMVVTGDEEVGGTGVELLLEKMSFDKAVILDSDADNIVVAASGIIHGWIKVKGKAGHAGYPHRADNAVEKAIKFLHEFISKYKPLREGKISQYNAPRDSPKPKTWGRFNVTVVKLGPREPEKLNRIPGEVLAGFDIRLIPEEKPENAVEELKKVFNEVVSETGITAELEITCCRNGWYATDKNLVAEALFSAEEAYRRVYGIDFKLGTIAQLGGNDGTHFFNKGIPCVGFGTHRPNNNLHGENEFVYLKDIDLVAEFIVQICVKRN